VESNHETVEELEETFTSKMAYVDKRFENLQDLLETRTAKANSNHNLAMEKQQALQKLVAANQAKMEAMAEAEAEMQKQLKKLEDRLQLLV
jgi:hypothetical protein